jgi:hypothetical protein
MSFPTIAGTAVENSLYREAQSCLGSAFALATYKFFLSGTTTPANVYQDGALTTPFPITGFVTADLFGRFPPIYLDTSVIYKVQFFDRTNTLRWTVDPYTAPLATVGTSSLSAFGMTIAPTGEASIPAPNTGGTGISLTLNAGALGSTPLMVSATLPGQSTLIINNSVTTGVQTATFTATNKPGTATSSPAGWLPFTCDGVQYYTPIWHGNNFTPYVASPSALGETINASNVTFGGNGATSAANGTATPSNWFTPTTTNIGSGYWIKITKTGGLSGIGFSAAFGIWQNIGAGGLAIGSNAQSPITGTYQLSTSATGSPVVANGTITLSNNNGVQSPTYNGATPLMLAGDGTATLNGAGSSNWLLPTTANVGSGYWIKLTQTGGTSGYSFSAASGTYTNITNGGLTIGISGPAGNNFNVSGTYIIASDSGGVNQLGTGNITLTGGTNVQSPNWSGITPLVLAGNGSATLNGASTSSWYSPNASNVGAGYWIKITRTSGTTGVNFTAAQGSWTNITNSGLSIGMSGYTGDVGTVTVGGTYQISNNSGGTPVLGSGTISLSVNAGTVTHTYATAVTNATETIPIGATTCVIEVWGASGGGGCTASGITAASGGGSGGYSRTSVSVTGGKTFTYTVGVGGPAATNPGVGVTGGLSSVVAGTQAITTITDNGGAGGSASIGGAGGAASGGTAANTTGNSGSNATAGTPGGAGGAGIVGVNGTGNAGGIGGIFGAGIGTAGGTGKIIFSYS